MPPGNNSFPPATDRLVRRAERCLAAADPIMKRLIAAHGHCPLAAREYAPFHMLANSIISQQLSTKAASAIKQRLTGLLPAPFAPEKFLQLSREQLRTAYEMFSDMGIPGFAERARRELAATGETARKRTDDTRGDLTAQESQIAQLASDGLTNPEIGAKLFLSPRTIEWHLRRIYPKLGVGSRRELRAVLRSTRAEDGQFSRWP